MPCMGEDDSNVWMQFVQQSSRKNVVAQMVTSTGVKMWTSVCLHHARKHCINASDVSTTRLASGKLPIYPNQEFHKRLMDMDIQLLMANSCDDAMTSSDREAEQDDLASDEDIVSESDSDEDGKLFVCVTGVP